jgi:2-polyprenyl-3-methyl-5-hydroxy-6-metoxy-1,4-benzoquinol methylase/spore coat polysaccharide biosynthesis predicted glycosyltransferase SpsG
MEKNMIIIVPAYKPGLGGGHIVRCIQLTIDLQALGRDARLCLPLQSTGIDSLFQSMNFNPGWRITKKDIQGIKPVDLIVIDRFRTPPQELCFWKKIAPVFGIDEGHSCRDSFDFLIDILPNLEKIKPNIANPALLRLPLKKTFLDKKSNRILITFGHEDSAGLGFLTAKELSKNNSENFEITLLQGSLGDKEKGAIAGVKVIPAIPNLAEQLYKYDLVITHYGITAFESLYAGTPVLLINPTSYHEKLAKAAGFIYIKKKKLSSGDVSRLCSINYRDKLLENCKKLAEKFNLDKEGKNLAVLVNNFSPQVNRHCPVCGGNHPVNSLARFTERTYRRCGLCGIIYMDRTCQPQIEYKKDYFFEQYKKQYGKTYIDDFPNLIAMAKRRIKIIRKLMNSSYKLNSSPSLLDIGCAYGPFLTAAREEGFSPAGIDPCEDAIRYVQKELGIQAGQGFFPDCLQGVHTPAYQSFDVITLWFVIEHFQDCIPVLAEIKKMLKPKGILAFSSPSFSGISGFSSMKRFLEQSPEDHYTIWSPKMCRKALVLSGFKVKKIKVLGHHPERFPLPGKLAKSKKNPIYWLFLAISKIFRLGDSFEVYAQAS